jgi:hypothetical protein
VTWDFNFNFFSFVICCPFLSERRFSGVFHHRIRKKSVVSKSVTEGTHQDSCSGKTKFETWKKKSKRKQIDTEKINKPLICTHLLQLYFSVIGGHVSQHIICSGRWGPFKKTEHLL